MQLQWPVASFGQFCWTWFTNGFDLFYGLRTGPTARTQNLRSYFHESSPPNGDALSATNHEPTLFFSLLAPRLPHVVQGAEDTCESGCEVHDDRIGEESIGVVELSHHHGARFV